MVSRSTAVQWLFLDPTERSSLELELQEWKIESDDDINNPGIFSPRQETIYHVERATVAPGLNLVYPEGIIHSMIIGSSTKTYSYSRSVYSILDFLGSVGGLYGIFQLIANFFVSHINGYNFFNKLTTLVLFAKPTNQLNLCRKFSLASCGIPAMEHAISFRLVSPFPMLFLIFKPLLLCKRFKDRKLLVQSAESRLGSHLDVVKLIKR